MKALLVGCGYWGRNWARTLNQMDALAGVCEPFLPNQDFLKQNYPEIPVYSNLEEALNHCPAPAVIIASPAVTHAEVALECLQANRHVLIEKPLALSTEDAEHVVQAAENKGLTLAVGHLLMYHPGLLRLKALMDEGALGDILSVQCTRTNLGKIRNEENSWWSLAPHDLSILSLLLNEPFHLSTAIGMPVLGRPHLPDTVSAWYQTDSGRQASIQVSWLAPEKKHETVVIGTQKIAIFDDAKPAGQKLAILDYAMEGQGGLIHHIQRGNLKFIAYGMPDELLTLEARAFLAGIRDRSVTLPNSGQNGLEVVRHLNAVQALLDQTMPTRIPV
ncbi:Gfo/Idh/MocA family protein [Vampirovibrio chlorellavorus]|uniref:Gfo/Idh/MocA family protein n=1 Tax=Vampirovibrio chlorellavorus TaxID=758823 RepID=UPI0026F340B3|nr:Gfo/Idh/MocA family oxidoreductase [Vampirovibrio chlorellavorus]